ncbi:YbaB/EbfC family nucleoid-associated protein [Planctomicrobium sp. SH664]|uniref:YbaB/EbfC family nucleoid-associated protein n=1 Tax=Planctomicrobium sp. SH664 TaxID=3448125 RepID=UPI003F5BB910
MFQGLSNLAGLMKNAQQMQARAQELKQRLGEVQVSASVGGGMVRVEATGDQKITSIHVDPSLLDDREMLEDLLLSGVNQALEQAREAAATEMSKLAEGLGIPGIEDALSRFGFGK